MTDDKWYVIDERLRAVEIALSASVAWQKLFAALVVAGFGGIIAAMFSR